ncbi:hypothetical protein [Roseovarius sp. EL26]|uniref:hypothetical protein n=1 Tax=Roseovarius sp. EL26 TaxID=2126672 RepID=UPI000EA03801|nr:hypothetical protein [Roseovarius sp. EL26]
MKYRILLSLLIFGWACNPSTAQMQDRFWILWERLEQNGTGCPDGPNCLKKHRYSSRLFDAADSSAMYRLFGMMDGAAMAQGRLAEHPDAPRICQHNSAEVILGFNPETLPKSEKIEALRGISGFGFDVRKLKAPPGFSDTFGDELQAAMKTRFRQAGLRVLSKEETAATPGQPELNIYFSFRDPGGHCDYSYSVFASLSQTVLLTRDLRIKLSAGVWSYSTSSPALQQGETEWDALLSVADALIRDHRKVNTSN